MIIIFVKFVIDLARGMVCEFSAFSLKKFCISIQLDTDLYHRKANQELSFLSERSCSSINLVIFVTEETIVTMRWHCNTLQHYSTGVVTRRQRLALGYNYYVQRYITSHRSRYEQKPGLGLAGGRPGAQPNCGSISVTGASLGAHKTRGSRPWGRGRAP